MSARTASTTPTRSRSASRQPAVRRRQRRAIPRGERRPGLLLRETARGVAGRAGRDARHLRLHRAGLARRPTRTGTSKPACSGIPKTRAASVRSSACNTGRTAIASLNLAYRAQRDRLEQAEVSGAWPIGKRWNAYGARGLQPARRARCSSDSPASNTRPAAGACAPWRAASISNREGTQETGFYLQLELNGLSSVGNADAFLEHTIRGYSPETSAR